MAIPSPPTGFGWGLFLGTLLRSSPLISVTFLPLYVLASACEISFWWPWKYVIYLCCLTCALKILLFSILIYGPTSDFRPLWDLEDPRHLFRLLSDYYFFKINNIYIFNLCMWCPVVPGLRDFASSQGELQRKEQRRPDSLQKLQPTQSSGSSSYNKWRLRRWQWWELCELLQIPQMPSRWFSEPAAGACGASCKAYTQHLRSLYCREESKEIGSGLNFLIPVSSRDVWPSLLLAAVSAFL